MKRTIHANVPASVKRARLLNEPWKLQLVFDLVGSYLLTAFPSPTGKSWPTECVATYIPPTMLAHMMTPSWFLQHAHSRAERHFKCFDAMITYNIKWRQPNDYRDINSVYHNRSAFLGCLSTYANVYFPFQYFAIDVQAQSWRIQHWGDWSFSQMKHSQDLTDQYYQRFYVKNELMKRYWSHLADYLDDDVKVSMNALITGPLLIIYNRFTLPDGVSHEMPPHYTGIDHHSDCRCNSCNEFI